MEIPDSLKKKAIIITLVSSLVTGIGAASYVKGVYEGKMESFEKYEKTLVDLIVLRAECSD